MNANTFLSTIAVVLAALLVKAQNTDTLSGTRNGKIYSTVNRFKN